MVRRQQRVRGASGGKWDLPYAAGIAGEVRFIYIPGHYYNWSAPTVKKLERDVPYHAFYFNPAGGKRYDLGTVIRSPARRPSPLKGTPSPKSLRNVSTEPTPPRGRITARRPNARTAIWSARKAW